MIESIAKVALVAAIAASLAGCSDGESCKNDYDYRALSENAVLVKVGNRYLRKGDLESWIDCRIAMAKSVQSEMKSISNETLAAQLYIPTFRQFSTKALYLDAADKAGITSTEEDISVVSNEVVMSYGNGVVKSIEGFRKRLSPRQFAALQKKMADDALVLAYWRSLAPDAFVVTDEEFAAIEKRAEDMNKWSEQKLEEQRAKAEELYKKIAEGENFGKLALAESVTANEDVNGCFWGEFSPNEIPYPEIADVVDKMKPGEVSKPIELEDGIHIIKLIERKGSKNVSVFAPEEETVSLERIVVRLPIMYNVGTTNEIRRDMRTQKLEPLQKDWIEKLRSETAIEYPCGTNLWSFLRKKRRSPATVQ